MGGEARIIAVAAIVLAIVLIAVGRTYVRRARRVEAVARRRSAALGWMMVGLGTLLMIAGVVVW